MKWHEILVRYGEITTKGKNRKQFINRLRENIRYTFQDLDQVHIRSERDRMYLSSPSDEEMDNLIERLPTVFGIQSFSPVAECPTTLEDMKNLAVEIVKGIDYEGKTFKVNVKRSYKKFELETYELNREVATHVLSTLPGMTVQMKDPDIELRIEVREQATYMMVEVIQGAAGLPVGSNGKALLLLSGGIDSPVAAYYMMKRGVRIEAIHFFSPPFTSDQSLGKVMELCEQISHFGGNVRLHVIPFTEVQQTIQQAVPENVTMTSTRRMMMKISDIVRKEIDALALVTGENLGQVASQTLDSLAAINDVTTTPILRPLITYDKLEIIEIAQKIGTYETSIRPFEDCCTVFTPANPKTKPRIDKMNYYEGFTDFDEMIERAVKNREVHDFPKKKVVDAFDDLL
ncbi:putative tRNA sulfurtransferase [Kurthia zopfii]|uniref:Probable tRNA sulfurtransferase n=1 Tax=Kurthia zopfii TaxID=1650 RepID=A0A2U3AF15_9BACL|nr:tRNA uracil 4-sulfurtransferase ThiI [Kurthia zopfii]PWI23104.1 tRNA 4-thiouridine(8) synthase ThiI [Kurthia zopfii]TDR40569.1 thiamine biosynthesis protein ThiI [Kurthia zopfii]STX10308.1 Probable tRNA sulfurtransferase [Kurthia zopfii]VEI08412.1 Probable tRNA sulfurtransferase [Kurthia zopfii]GEK30128.1 putative tRNA sulfurtransferase [Kurthia zopfii]